MKAYFLWTLWQDLLLGYAFCFTPPGFARFAEWITGLVLNSAPGSACTALGDTAALR